MISSKIKWLSISFFLIGLVSVFAVFGYRNVTPAFSTKEVKVSYRETSQSEGDSSPVLQTTKYRLERADGSWKETTNSYAEDGTIYRSYDTFGIVGQGVYTVDARNNQLKFVGNYSKPHVFSEEGFKSQPSYAGESEVAGFRALIQKSANGDRVDEVYIAPDLDGLLLKIKTTKGKDTLTLEATEIKIEPVTDKEFGLLPDYPVNYDSIKIKNKAVEKAGQK